VEADPPPTDDNRPARATGVVNLATPGGWAIVLHRGRRVGQTPGRFTLPAGRQTLTLLPFGEPPARRITVDVPRGGVERQSIPLE
jgi:serine/threonine-protein kinase